MEKNKINTIIICVITAIIVILAAVIIALSINKYKTAKVGQEVAQEQQPTVAEPIEKIRTVKAQKILNTIFTEFTNEQKVDLYNKYGDEEVDKWDDSFEEMFGNWLDSLTNKQIEGFETDVIKEEVVETPSAEPTPVLNKYYIKVNNQMNTVTIYTYDSNGEYTIPVKAMICSTGDDTPKNSKYQLKSRWNWGGLFYGVYGQYCVHIVDNILFHSVPYTVRYDPTSLEYWEYDKLGTTASAGCVRLTVADALWIYNNCPYGTWVEFYSSPNPGPLGKPTARKISDATDDFRGWDPTDPNPNNAWNWYVPSVPTPITTLEVVETPTDLPTANPETATPETPTPEIIESPTPIVISTPTPVEETSSPEPIETPIE